MEKFSITLILKNICFGFCETSGETILSYDKPTVNVTLEVLCFRFDSGNIFFVFPSYKILHHSVTNFLRF